MARAYRGTAAPAIGGPVEVQDRAFLAPLGAKRIRLQSGWAKTETERGVYPFEWLDRIIDGSLEQGVDP